MTAQNIYEIEVETIDRQKISMSEYRDKVLLIVNVASKCGFTPQYKGLQELYEKYKGNGLEILGFPCNQFGFQEPGNEDEIKSFCSLTYNVSFPMFARIDVNGEQAHPLYKLLKSQCKGIFGTEGVKWNFTKFLVDRNGQVVDRFAPSSSPQSLEKEIASRLG